MGSGECGSLGNGQNGGDVLSPVKIMDDVEQVSVGFQNTGVIKKDGSLWMWGGMSMGSGRCGDGTKTNRNTPVKIMDNVKKVEVGGFSSVHTAIKKDGSLWMWGYGRYILPSGGNDQLTPKRIKDFNPMTVKVKPVKIKYQSLKKKRTMILKKKIIVKNSVGKIKIYKTSGNKKIIVKKNGSIKINEPLNRGSYKVGIYITAKGNKNCYSTAQSKTLKIIVK